MLVLLALAVFGQPSIVLPLGSGSIGNDGTGTCLGNVAEDECRLATVAAVNIESITADLKIQLPAGESVGTVIFFRGTGSAEFVETASADAEAMMTTLAQTYDFTVVQAKFNFPAGVDALGAPAHAPGWNNNLAGTGMKPASGRGATLIDLIYDNTALHPAGTALCVYGLSGGSVLVANAVLHFGLGEEIDLGILSGGPPMARIDWHCEHLTNREWVAYCNTHQLSGTAPSCGGRLPEFVDDMFGWNGRNGDCAWKSNRGSVPWRQHSTISNGANYTTPNTKWRFIHGAQDTNTLVIPGAKMMMGELDAYNPDANATEETVVGVGHVVPSTAAGCQAIIDALVEDCVVRP